MSLLTCPRCGDLCPPDAIRCECGATLILGFEDQGYWHVRAPQHHLAQKNGRVRAHRLVAEKASGRPLRPAEVVHHLNGDTLDNRPENLVVCADNAEHRRKYHGEDAA